MRNGNFKFAVNSVALLDQMFQLVDEVAPVQVIMKQTSRCPPFVNQISMANVDPATMHVLEGKRRA